MPCFKAINRGEFVLNGLRNRGLQPLLYNPGPLSPVEKDAARPPSVANSAF
jgi:hypothetical protein